MARVLRDKEHKDKSYQAWLVIITQVNDPHYYNKLFDFAEQILEDDKQTTNHDMSKKLCVNPQQFSTIKKMLQVYIFNIKPTECLLTCNDRNTNIYIGA